MRRLFSPASQFYSLAFSILLLAALASRALIPNLDLAALDKNFRGRRDLVALYSNVRMQLGDRVFNKAVVGGDGWIFYTGELSIPDYQNTIPFSEERLQTLQAALDELNASLAARGQVLLVVIAPNKSTIYPQYMPAEIPVLGSESRLDQFLSYMRQHGQTQVLDLRQPLIAASREAEVYYKVDTHWNDTGAYYAYWEILTALAQRDPRLSPHPLSDYEYAPHPGLAIPDLPMVLGLPQFEESHWLLAPKFPTPTLVVDTIPLPNDRQVRTTTAPGSTLPSLLIFHDSFYTAYGSLSGLMEPHFSRVTAVPFTTEPGVWSLDWVGKEDADIVIVEVVERYLDLTLPRLLKLAP